MSAGSGPIDPAFGTCARATSAVACRLGMPTPGLALNVGRPVITLVNLIVYGDWNRAPFHFVSIARKQLQSKTLKMS